MYQGFCVQTISCYSAGWPTSPGSESLAWGNWVWRVKRLVGTIGRAIMELICRKYWLRSTYLHFFIIVYSDKTWYYALHSKWTCLKSNKLGIISLFIPISFNGCLDFNTRDYDKMKTLWSYKTKRVTERLIFMFLIYNDALKSTQGLHFPTL